jgi:hypothetical protein
MEQLNMDKLRRKGKKGCPIISPVVEKIQGSVEFSQPASLHKSD